jgi:3-hydroxybutyrate dehydrogenase
MNQTALSGKVALVTGAASGIGEACARALASAGAAVVIADMNMAGATRVADAIVGAGGKALALCMDVSSEAQVNAGIDEVVRHFGQIDLLLANAGVQIVHPIEDFPFEDWKKCSPFMAMVHS